jgi:hypothetical protein
MTSGKLAVHCLLLTFYSISLYCCLRKQFSILRLAKSCEDIS